MPGASASDPTVPQRLFLSTAVDPAAVAVTTTLLLGLALPAAYALWTSLTWPLVHDAPIVHYIAWRIGDGAVPYRDIFDMNQPGVYLIHRAVLRLLGETDLAWRMFDLLILAWTALAIRTLAAWWGAAPSAGAALFFVGYHLMGGAWHLGERDFLLCPLLVTGAAAVVAWLEREGSRLWLLIGAALSFGVAMTIKPHTAVFGIAVGVVATILGRRSGRVSWLPPVAYVGALMLPCVGAMLWLAGVGALGPWRQIMTEYVVPLYSHVGRAHAWPIFGSPLWGVVIGTIVISVSSTVRGDRFSASHGIALIGVMYGAAHYFGQGKAWPYHLYPLAAFSAVLLFSELQSALEATRRVRSVAVLAGLVAVTILLGMKVSEAARSESVWDKEAIIRQAVHDIGTRVRPGDTVQVLDTAEGGLHALLRLHLRQPTRFIYDFHFFHDTESPTIRNLRAEFIDAMRLNMPRLVVVFRDGWPSGGDARLAAFPELSEHIHSHYTIAERRRWYTVFECRCP